MAVALRVKSQSIDLSQHDRSSASIISLVSIIHILNAESLFGFESLLLNMRLQIMRTSFSLACQITQSQQPKICPRVISKISPGVCIGM